MAHETLVDKHLSARIESLLKSPSQGWWLFGSYARGDAVAEESDVDVLHISPVPQLHYSEEEIQVTVYTPAHLFRMAKEGNLFVYHIITEAKIGRDEQGLLAELSRQWVKPSNYTFLRSEIWSASVVLDATDVEFTDRVGALASTARYLLRSYVYSVLMDRGELTFNWPDAVRRFGDARLLTFSRKEERWTYSDFVRARELLWEYCGARVSRSSVSLEALLPALSLRSPLASVLAMRILADRQSIIEYA